MLDIQSERESLARYLLSVKNTRELLELVFTNQGDALDASAALYAYRKGKITEAFKESVPEQLVSEFKPILLYLGNQDVVYRSDIDLCLYFPDSTEETINEVLKSFQESFEKIYYIFRNAADKKKEGSALPPPDPGVPPPDQIVTYIPGDLRALIGDASHIASSDFNPKAREIKAARERWTSMLFADWSFSEQLGLDYVEDRKSIYDRELEEVGEEFSDFLLKLVISGQHIIHASPRKVGIANPHLKKGGLRLLQMAKFIVKTLELTGQAELAKEMKDKYLSDPELQAAYRMIIALRHAVHLASTTNNLVELDHLLIQSGRPIKGEDFFLEAQSRGFCNAQYAKGLPREHYYRAARLLAFNLQSLIDEVLYRTGNVSTWATPKSITRQQPKGINGVLAFLAAAAEYKQAIRSGEFKNVLAGAEIAKDDETPDPNALMKVFLGSQSSGNACRLLNDSGLLSSRIFPELKEVEGCISNRHQKFTVLEHSVRAVELLSDLSNPDSDRDPRFKKLYQKCTDQERTALTIALLHHDYGYPREHASKGVCSHDSSGAARLRYSLSNMGFEDQIIDDACTLVLNHRWIIRNPLTSDWLIATEVDQAPEELRNKRIARLLALHTYADLHTSMPDHWTRIVANQIYQSYLQLADTKHVDHGDIEQQRAHQAKILLREYPKDLDHTSRDQIIEVFRTLPPEYVALSRLTLRDQLLLLAKYKREGSSPHALLTQHDSHESDRVDQGIFTYDLNYVCPNAPGTLVRLFTEINRHKCNVHSVDIFTSSEDIALGRITLSRSREVNIDILTKCIEEVLSLNFLSHDSPVEVPKDVKRARDLSTNVATIQPLNQHHCGVLTVSAKKTPGLVVKTLARIGELGFDVNAAYFTQRPNNVITYQLYLTPLDDHAVKIISDPDSFNAEMNSYLRKAGN